MTVYLDCNATSPIEPEVLELVMEWLARPGNATSRTHSFGLNAQRAVKQARERIAGLIQCDPSEVVFTSGATEANNLALLGLVEEGERSNRKHVVTTAIEHKAVLEPVYRLQQRGFEITVVKPNEYGCVSAAAILEAIRPDTLIVSIMHANNETGVIQPLMDVAQGLEGHAALLHTDAAQSFGKEMAALQSSRIDLVSISGHKLYAPQGVGALIARRRHWRRPPLAPLMLGGGHEGGYRSGTLPVALIAGLGLAAELAGQHGQSRRVQNLAVRQKALAELSRIGAVYPCNDVECLPHVLSMRIPGLDSEASMLAAREYAAFSNGSACNSHSYESSHVLQAMGMVEPQISEVVRLSWSHLTPAVDWRGLANALASVASVGRSLG